MENKTSRECGAMPQDELTIHFSRLQEGDEQTLEHVWRDYFEKMVRSARRKLGERGRRAADEEDVALSAMKSFCKGVRAGQFENLHDRGSLWGLLMTLTARKASRHTRREMAQKRGGGAVRGESVFMRADAPEDLGGIGQVLGSEPTPEFALEVSENCTRLLEGLKDTSLREIALLKLEGYTNEEIARRQNVVPRTIERKLGLIRVQWSDKDGQAASDK